MWGGMMEPQLPEPGEYSLMALARLVRTKKGLLQFGIGPTRGISSQENESGRLCILSKKDGGTKRSFFETLAPHPQMCSQKTHS